MSVQIAVRGRLVPQMLMTTRSVASASNSAGVQPQHRTSRSTNSKDVAVHRTPTARPNSWPGGFVDHGSPVPLPPGPGGYTQILGFLTQVLDVSYEVKETICTEDRIVVRAVGNGTAVAAVHGPAVAGRPYRMDTVHVYRTEGGRLAEHWGVRDELGV